MTGNDLPRSEQFPSEIDGCSASAMTDVLFNTSGPVIPRNDTGKKGRGLIRSAAVKKLIFPKIFYFHHPCMNLYI